MTNWGGYYPPGVSDRDFVDRGPWLCKRCAGEVYNEDHIEGGLCMNCREDLEEEMKYESTSTYHVEVPSWEKLRAYFWANFYGRGHITDRYGLEAGPRHVRR